MKHLKKCISALALLVVASVSCLAVAEVAVIVHPSNGNTLTESQISKLYLGKAKKFPSGGAAIPIDRSEGDALRVSFLDKVVGKSEQQMKSYWSRLIFTGKGVPPKIVASDAEIIELIGRNQDAIGYVESSSVNDSVKVILTF